MTRRHRMVVTPNGGRTPDFAEMRGKLLAVSLNIVLLLRAVRSCQVNLRACETGSNFMRACPPRFRMRIWIWILGEKYFHFSGVMGPLWEILGSFGPCCTNDFLLQRHTVSSLDAAQRWEIEKRGTHSKHSNYHPLKPCVEHYTDHSWLHSCRICFLRFGFQ